MVKSRVQLSLIADKTSRRSTFRKRKRGFLKKLSELATLCGVKACAVIANGEDDPNPEAWPSKEGAEEVYSKFLEFPVHERASKKHDQWSYMEERIKKQQDKMAKLQYENREMEIRDLMFDLLKGKRLMPHHFNDASVFKDLSIFIDRYLNRVNHRIQTLEVNGESSSLPPLDVPAVGDVNPAAVSDVAAVSTPLAFDHPAAVSDVAAVTTPLALFDHPGAVSDVAAVTTPLALFDHPAAVSDVAAVTTPLAFFDHPAGVSDVAAVTTPLALFDHPAAVSDATPLAMFDHPAAVSDVAAVTTPLTFFEHPAAASDVAAVTTTLAFFDHISPYQNMNQQAPENSNDHILYQNMNQQELAQYQVPSYFSDHAQYQNMNHQEQFQYQEPSSVYDQLRRIFYGSNQGMSSNLNHNLSESSNQYPNQWKAQPPQMMNHNMSESSNHCPNQWMAQPPQMINHNLSESSNHYPNQWMAQPPQMSYAEELPNFASMDDNYYRYHQLPTTSYMPSITTTATTTTTTTAATATTIVDLTAPNTNNKHWPTRFGLD